MHFLIQPKLNSNFCIMLYGLSANDSLLNEKLKNTIHHNLP